jgi:hypothetical protein
VSTAVELQPRIPPLAIGVRLLLPALATSTASPGAGPSVGGTSSFPANWQESGVESEEQRGLAWKGALTVLTSIRSKVPRSCDRR